MSWIKDLIKGIIIYYFSKRNHDIIVFESYPDFSDNTKAVYDEMMRREYYKRYRMVWICRDCIEHPFKPNTKFIKANAWGGIPAFFETAKACCLVSGNFFLCSKGEYQKAIYVMHGIGLKKAGTYQPHGKLDYITGLSDDLNRMISRELNVPNNIMLVTGYPRNDALVNSSINRKYGLFKNNYKKIIAWYPTFRQHAHNEIIDSKISLPIIHDIDSAMRINEVAEKLGVLIVLKPHFAQDISKIKDLGLGNIIFINDDFFDSNHISSYEFVGACDALITDYSSIYFDYLLVNKPVAVVWEDIEIYRKSRGFALDIDYYMKGAVKIYNENDFISFITSISNEKDELKDERERIKNEVHTYQDANSSVRVVDFIETNILKR